MNTHASGFQDAFVLLPDERKGTYPYRFFSGFLKESRMAGPAKKAKLAHEKQKATAPKRSVGDFTFKKVVDVVEWPQGNSVAIVELQADGEPLLGIVDRHFVMSKTEGNYEPSRLACPAVYDPIARELAIERHRAYSAAN
jgi:hypothetical protein